MSPRPSKGLLTILIRLCRRRADWCLRSGRKDLVFDQELRHRFGTQTSAMEGLTFFYQRASKESREESTLTFYF